MSCYYFTPYVACSAHYLFTLPGNKTSDNKLLWRPIVISSKWKNQLIHKNKEKLTVSCLLAIDYLNSLWSDVLEVISYCFSYIMMITFSMCLTKSLVSVGNLTQTFLCWSGYPFKSSNSKPGPIRNLSHLDTGGRVPLCGVHSVSTDPLSQLWFLQSFQHWHTSQSTVTLL